MMASEAPVWMVGDRVTVAADHPPILGGAPVVWTIVELALWPGTDFVHAVLRPADRSGYAERSVSVGRLVRAPWDGLRGAADVVLDRDAS